MKQYEIWWASLPLPAGRRPVLLLSRNRSYGYLTKVAAAEVTTRIRGLPTEVPLGRNEGLQVRSVATLDNIRPVPVTALTERIGTLSNAKHRAVKRALGYAFEWDELISL
ncbi:MAG: type II toxin-antitoxin system PemK/MazF family toxin [Acidobacteria bacterium]|nr:type II toxin-antitoxin system PemK/MazF family toxin [Acidobacteriota bacterium]